MASPRFYNWCWMLACYAESRAYRWSSRNVRKAQSQVLQRIVSSNSDTWFGKEHQFRTIGSVEEFRRSVPVTTYEDYLDAINRIARGEKGVLTTESVELLEPTGGSTTGEKLIPYTNGLKRSFQRAIRVWMWDLLSQCRSVREGYAYWSISPLANQRRSTESGIPIGFDDDSAYLGRHERVLLSKTLAVPPQVAACKSVPVAQYATLFYLLNCRKLGLISVWSPTFLSEMLASLQLHWESLCDDLDTGVIRHDYIDSLAEHLQEPIPPSPERAAEIRALMGQGQLPRDWVSQVWPELSLVSCWADGPSAPFARKLADSLPGIEIQPKGLLATEAVVSVPLLGRCGAGLAVRSNFLEFQPVDELGSPCEDVLLLADELRPGGRYRVIVTTPGGLYRYQMKDEIEVVGFYDQIPLARFLGKADRVSDIVGEKLSEAFVCQVLECEFHNHDVVPHYYDVMAECDGERCYVLRIADSELAGDSSRLTALREDLERAFRRNPGYRYARELGQLGHMRISIITPRAARELHEKRTKELVQTGTRHGDIKPSILQPPSPQHSGPA